MAIGSVARKLPDFVSQFPSERTTAILKHLAGAIAKLSSKSAATLKQALEDSGYSISLPPSAFSDNVADFVKLVHFTNRSPLELANA